MEGNAVSPDRFSLSELVKYEGKDCVILDIKKNSLWWNEYQLWNVENGEVYVTVKSRLGKNSIESIDFSTFENDFDESGIAPADFQMKEEIDDNLLLMVSDSFEEASSSNRHCSLSTEDLNKIAEANNEVSTSHSTKWAVRVFKDWLVERAYSAEFEMLSSEELSMRLRQFYGEANPKKEGDLYSRSSLTGIRAGINRYLQSPPYNRTISIVLDREFLPANKVLTDRVKLNRSKGLDVTKHKAAIPAGDIEKMYSSEALSNTNPLSLQNKVFFELCLHFGHRGREGLHSLKKTSFQFGCHDADKNIEYVTLNFNEKTKKNHGTDSKRKECDQRMYSSPSDPNCPVTSLKLYMSKLHPEQDSLFQKPRNCVNVESLDIWYCNKPLGMNTLSNKMKMISKQAKLSQIYTNHCIRATTSTVLAHSNFNQNDIISVTGHKDPKSLLPYVASTSSFQRKEMSGALYNYGKGKENINIPSTITSKTESMVSHHSPVHSTDIMPLTQTLSNVTNTSTVTYNMVSEVKEKKILASELATKIFEGNTITGGQFTINFNFN